jgi:ornithine cyclodeaminase
MPLVLTESDVRAVLTMPDLIQSMKAALVEFSTGRVQQPLRTVLEVADRRAFWGVMPAMLDKPAAMGTKMVTVFPTNRDLGLPSHLATIVLLDPATGALLAILDGRYITEARTAAVSAVSVDLLAGPKVRTLAILGAGVQARSHVEALGCIRPFETIRVWSPTESRRNAFVDEVQAHTAASIAAAASMEEAVDGADVIVLATASPTPVLLDGPVAEGTHICAVGACRPNHREMEGVLVGRARTFVDSRAGALAEAGDIVLAIAEGVITPDHIAGELGELAAGNVAGRQHDRQVTLFKSLGMAVEDVVAAHLAFSRATARGLGTNVRL